MKHALHTFSLCLVLLFASVVTPCGTSSAQTITTLDWSVMRIDSVLPHYSEVVPLARDYAQYDFSVSIQYATWQLLAQSEERMARTMLDQLADTLVINSHVGASRGQGLLDIDFIPIIYNKETDVLKKLLQCKIVITATPRVNLRNVRRQAAEDEDTTHTNSVLDSGRWVKIAVSEDGIYSLTPSMLSQMGFNDPERVRLYGYGGHLLPEVMNSQNYYDDLEEIPLLRTASGNLLFWGNGVIAWDWDILSSTIQHHTINNYSTKGYYFVTDVGTPAVLKTEEPWSGESSEVASFTEWVVRDVDEFAWFTGGRRLWESKDLGAAGGSTYTISTPGACTGDTPMLLRMSIANGADETNRVTAVWNDSTLNTITVSTFGKYESAGTMTSNIVLRGVNDGGNTLKLTAQASPARLDYIELTYSRAFAMNAAALPFHLDKNEAAKIKLDKQNAKEIALMRRGTPGKPATLISPQDDESYVIANAKGDFVFIQTDATFPQPAIVGEIGNQNLHAHEPVDMVIIIPASGLFASEAARLADAHLTYDSLKCRVVRADQIYNEFSSGTPDATAYRLYMKMLYDKAVAAGTPRPRYLLLFGDAAWDNRMLTQDWRNLSPDNFLLCFESDNSLSDIQCYVMEDYFGLLDEGEGSKLNSDKVDLGIGRFPVRSEGEAKIMVDKSIEHIQGSRDGLWNNLALVMGDDGDANSHMEYADTLANRLIRQYPARDTRKLMWDSYKRVTTTTGNTFPELNKLIHNYVDDGVGFVNYIGHGATYVLSHENVITLADVAQFKNKNKGLWYTAACDVMPFEGRSDNIGESMAVNQYGSAVFIGTTRTVYANYNNNLNCAFSRYVFSCDPVTGQPYSAGDALRMAKCDMTESGSIVNKLHYALLGDPSLVFAKEQYRVVIDSINGIGLAEADAHPQLKAGARCVMTGHVEDKEGNLMYAYDGLLTSRVLDTQESVTCLNQNGEKKAYVYNEHRKVLYEGKDSIHGGQFAFSFVVPKGINYDNTQGRAIFYATGNDGAANGHTNQYVVGGTSDELSGDKQGPDVQLWLDSEQFTDGGYVSSAPMLYARITDDSAVNYAAAGIGHGLEVSIDNRADMTFDISSSFVAIDSHGGTVAYQLPPQVEGMHTLQMRVWDVLDNATTVAVQFCVSGMDEKHKVQAVVNQNLSGVNISLVNSLTGKECTATVQLYDAMGHLCYSDEANGLPAGQTYTFYVNSNSLAGGVYMMQATMTQGSDVYQTETQKVIIRN